MRSHRRLLSAVALAGVAVFALAGCRTSPTVAAYVGDSQITENQVSDVYDDIAAGTKAAQYNREFVVETLVIDKLCGTLQAKKKFSSSPLDQANIADTLGVPANSPVVALVNKAYGCLDGYPLESKPLPDAELQKLLDGFKATGAAPANATLADARAQLDTDQFRNRYAQEQLLTQAAADQHVSVNPRYRQLSYDTYTTNGVLLFSAPFGEAPNGAVTDGPGESPSAAPTEPQS